MPQETNKKLYNIFCIIEDVNKDKFDKRIKQRWDKKIVQYTEETTELRIQPQDQNTTSRELINTWRGEQGGYILLNAVLYLWHLWWWLYIFILLWATDILNKQKIFYNLRRKTIRQMNEYYQQAGHTKVSTNGQ